MSGTDTSHGGREGMTQPYYVLEVTSPDGRTQSYDIREPVRIVGRSKVKADLQIMDKKISGRHCELRFENGKVTARDLGSTNGTVFDGQKRTDAVPLSPGVSFKLGDAVVRLMAVHEPDPPRTAVGSIPWGSDGDQEEETRALSASEIHRLKTNPPEIAPEAEMLDSSIDEPMVALDRVPYHPPPRRSASALGEDTIRRKPGDALKAAGRPSASAAASSGKVPPWADVTPPKRSVSAPPSVRTTGQTPKRQRRRRKYGPRPGISTFKASFKYLIIVCGLAGVTLSVVFKVWQNKPYGVAALVACAVPVLVALVCSLALKSFPRWAALISVIAFGIAMMKTNIGGDLQNIMFVSAVGMLLGVFLMVSPDRRWG